ncbi:MAG: hypothetical protein RL172_3182, partial [Bacteroidota bacterium]
VKWFKLLKDNNVELKLSELPAEGDAAHELPAVPKAKPAEAKQATTKAAPPKKINTPRKMA